MKGPPRAAAPLASEPRAFDPRELYAAIAESSFEALIACDRQGRIVAWNAGADRTFGYGAAEAAGQPLETLIATSYREEFSRLLAEALEGRVNGLFRSLAEHKDGHLVDLSVSLSPIRGAELGACMVARDVSERRKEEEEQLRVRQELLEREAALRKALAALRTSHEMLKHTQLQLVQAAKLESVGRLAAGVAHEVKNPLAIILSGTEYLLSIPAIATEAIEPVLQDIRHAVGRANDVVMGLLNYSAGTELNPSEADIGDVVGRALRMVEHAAKKGHVTIRKELAEGLPTLLIDVNKIEQVLVNLLINAIDATPEGGTVTIRTHREQLSARDKRAGFRKTDPLRVGDSVVLISVADTGTGIPQENLNKVFDPFFTTKPTGKGTGLGLAVCKTIVALHGGTILIANRPVRGAVATVVLRSATR